MLKFMCTGIILAFGLLFAGTPILADELSDTLSRMETLDIARGEYVLGKALTDKQKEKVNRQAVGDAVPLTYKFKDRNITVVAEKSTDRVIIMYEQYENASREKIREIVAALFLDFGDPTVLAHDKIIYWAFGPGGKLTREQYRKTRESNEKLDLLATIKLNSSCAITGKDALQEKEGSVYYIISSEAALKLLKKRDN